MPGITYTHIMSPCTDGSKFCYLSAEIWRPSFFKLWPNEASYYKYILQIER